MGTRKLVSTCLCFLFAADLACSGKASLSFAVDVPARVAGDTAWFELGAFLDSTCTSLGPMLFNGVPATATHHLAFRRGDSASRVLGDLARGTYAVAAVARGADCRVLATGCVELEIGKTESATLSLAEPDREAGSCEAGSACKAGRCVPSNDNSDPGVGAQCSLELVGAGPLASPVGGTGTTVSAPTIAATASGFVIAYREVDPHASSARVTLLPIDSAGGALTPARPMLNGRCPNADEADGLGLDVNGTEGQLVLARASCGSAPGLERLRFKSDPAITVSPDFRSSDSPAGSVLQLSSGHVLARGPTSTVVVFREDGVPRIATVIPNGSVGAPSGTFGGTENMQGAWVASSDKVLALLAAGPEKGGADAGSRASELGLVMSAANTPADAFNAASAKPHAPITFAGSWGAVAAHGSRVIVLAGTPAPGPSATYRTFDFGRTAASADAHPFELDGRANVLTGDVVMVDDKVFFALLEAGGVSLHAFDHASGEPVLRNVVAFAKEPRIPSVSGIRESGRVAIAATSSRVAVAWTTASTLAKDEPTGGYALFACTP
jgi:hypothetical protein